MYRHIFALQQVARRTISSSARRQMQNKVPEKQKLFQEDNGMPVHLKGGSADALLYRTTMALTVLGAGYVVYELVKASVCLSVCRREKQTRTKLQLHRLKFGVTNRTEQVSRIVLLVSVFTSGPRRPSCDQPPPPPDGTSGAFRWSVSAPMEAEKRPSVRD
ncbi:hypothetical protein Q8A73_018106 [Channa argus]|nr:hypothetical protein Q8A73_018106 [Channa argus]